MNQFAKFTFYQKDMDPQKVERLKAVAAELSAVRKEIEEDFRATEQFALLEKMAKPGSRVTLSWSPYEHIEVGINLQPDFLANQAQGQQPLYLGEKTINTLLNGKLLSDTEKRKLIERVTNGVIPAASDGGD